MEVIEKNKRIEISQLKNWDKNPRGITKKDFLRLKEQIKKFGIYKPLLVEKNGNGYEVVGGNMRLRALQELGFSSVDCWVLKFKDEQEKIEVSLSDNDRAGYYEKETLADLILPFKDKIELENFKIDISIPKISLKNLLGTKKKNVELENIFEVIVECKNEKEQKKIYEEFLQRGFKCRVLTF